MRHCHLGKSRAYELIAMAEDRTTEEESKAKARNRQAVFVAKNKASVSNGQSASTDPFADHLAAVIAAMKGATMADWAKLSFQYVRPRA